MKDGKLVTYLSKDTEFQNMVMLFCMLHYNKFMKYSVCLYYFLLKIMLK